MSIFKILLIILVSAPVIGFALYFYSQMIGFIKVRNKAEEDRLQAESRVRTDRKPASGNGKKKSAAKKNAKDKTAQSGQKAAKGKKTKGTAKGSKKEKRK
ncbi:MAG: hypothetical protein IJ227_01655 [Mogibacterium sp.]|nr:hypothetical protein [Mogibacterium sp.]